MNIVMSGLEHHLAPIALRERLSFTKVQTGEMDRVIASYPGVSGAVLISTCNRTELYLTGEENLNPGEILCQAAGAEFEPYQKAFLLRKNQQAVDHLMEVSAGLCSRIWGEDQIVSQVKNAIVLAREAGSSDSVLETLFRWAVAGGKEVRSRVHLTALPTSAASMAVKLLQEQGGDLSGKKAMVIGNGEMGRLAAALLHEAGCRVTVTLRTYRHGETVVPPGCSVVSYEERFGHMDGMDLLISATTSPHYTVSTEQLEQVSCPPKIMVDLAIPRDIQPEVGEIPGISLYNVDDLGDFQEHRKVPEEVTQILNAHREQFYRWYHYKDCMNTVDTLKEALVERMLTSRELETDITQTELIQLTVDKTVDLLVGGLAEKITSEQLEKCENKIRTHTTGKAVLS